ncbi:wolframin-like isoform X1 [Haliotis cracherodii]|uniref:wolframin-like isoform X1 n=1 Tax=Haliotis cracherodii TaxID=6455 RepID=UPI0039EAFAB8
MDPKPWESDFKSRSRTARPTSSEQSSTTPRWGAGSTRSTGSSYQDPAATRKWGAPPTSTKSDEPPKRRWGPGSMPTQSDDSGSTPRWGSGTSSTSSAPSEETPRRRWGSGSTRTSDMSATSTTPTEETPRRRWGSASTPADEPSTPGTESKRASDFKPRRYKSWRDPSPEPEATEVSLTLQSGEAEPVVEASEEPVEATFTLEPAVSTLEAAFITPKPEEEALNLAKSTDEASKLAESKPEQVPAPEPAPAPEPTPARKPEPVVAPVVAPVSAPVPKPVPEPKPKPEQEPKPKLNPVPESKPKSVPEPKPKSVPELKPKSVPEPKFKPVSEPKPKSVPEPKPKPPVKTVADPVPQPVHKPVPQAEKEEPPVNPEVIRSWESDANKGSEEHQLKLGKHFLSLADSDIERDRNGGLALDWLLRASKQGSEEATELLQSCVNRSLPGINERDANDITWCLKTSSYEKKIRYAARSLFQRINTTHKEALSKDEYMDAIKGVTGKVKEQRLLMAAGRKIGKEISENEFVKMLSKKIQGTVTLTTEELADTNVSYESAGYVTKIYRYPRQTFSSVMDQALEYSSQEGLNWVVSLIPTNQLYVLGLLFVYSFITPDFMFFFIPLFIFYLSFAAIIVCTLQMFYKKKKQNDAATLAGVLKELDVTIDLDKTESQFTWNSLTPYIVFFCNLPLVIASFSLCNKSYVPCAEITVISFVMTGLCFFSLSDHHDKLTFFALFANLLSSLPVFLHNFPSVPLLKQIIGFLTDPFIALDTGVGITFNVSIPSVAYAIIPLFFVRMATRKSWEGTYRVLIPHLVCYFWFNILTSTFPFTSWMGLARATIGYMLLPVLVPLSLVGVAVMFIFVVYKAFQTEMLGKIVVTVVLLAVPILMTQTKKIFGKKFDAKFGIAKKVIMVVFAILALVPLIFVRIPAWKKEVPVELSYENYTSLCFREKVVNDVPQQITCSHLIGTKITWTGTVEGVTVVKIENTAESVIGTLPSFVAKPLYCMYGQPFPQCDRKLLSKKGYSFCVIMRGLGHSCHVKNHNVYTFEILMLTGDQNIKIEAGDNFKETVLALEIGDMVQYRGSLTDNLGGTVPKLKLSSLKATNRTLPIMMHVDEDDDKYMSAVQEAIAVTFNFLWFPLLEFSTK